VREHILCGAVICHGTHMYRQHGRKEWEREKNGKDPWVFILSLGRQRESREMLRIFIGFTNNYSVHV